MPETKKSLPIEQAYAQLKTVLIENKCKIYGEKPPEYINIKQGSLSGIMPKSAKKNVAFHLSSVEGGTKIVSSSEIAADWKNLTIVGNILAAVLVVVFLWIASDIINYLNTGIAGLWAGLALAYGYPDVQRTMFSVNVIRGLAVFLTATIVFEIIVVLYVYPRKERFAQEMLKELAN